jgi:hypothetical protein
MNLNQEMNNQNLLAKSFGTPSSQRRGLKINKLFMFETGTYNTQYRRPYNTTLTGDVMSTIQEGVGGATTLNASAFSGVASRFLQPSSQPEATVPIANGWTERRMRFIMEVENTFDVGSTVTEMVQGYTTHTGVSTAGAIDPRMEFYINSVTHIRTTRRNTPVGMQSVASIFDSSHILANNNFDGTFVGMNDQRLRPTDVLTTIGRTHLTNAGSYTDLRVANTNLATKSNRLNNSPVNYLATLVGSYQRADLALTDPTRTENDLLDHARKNANENLVAEDPFMVALSQARNTGIGNVFTYGDLKRIFADIEHVTHARYMDATAKAVSHNTGQTAEWGASDRLTTVATIMVNAVPALLMELGLSRIAFKTSNRQINSQVITAVYDAKTFCDGDKSQALSAFIVNLENYILKDISFNNQTDFAIDMRADLLGETWLNISIDGLPPFDYVAPSFADSLLTPVITGNATLAMNIASDFENLNQELVFGNAAYGSSSVNLGRL